MKKFIAVCLLLYSLSSRIFAQDTSKSAIFVRVEAGLLNGPTRASTQFLATVAWAHNGYRLGIGTGIDYYRYRTVPVFLAAVRDFGNQKNRPYVYLNAGRDYAWPLENQFDFNVSWGGETNRTSFNNGWFGEAGAGVRLLSQSRPSILLSVGYSIKSLGEDWQERVYDPGGQVTIESRHSKYYQLNRLVFKLGLDF